MSKNDKFALLEVMVSIIFGLYGTDLTILQLQEYITLEFDEDFTIMELEDYLIEDAKNYKPTVTNQFTIEWADLNI